VLPTRHYLHHDAGSTVLLTVVPWVAPLLKIADATRSDRPVGACAPAIAASARWPTGPRSWL